MSRTSTEQASQKQDPTTRPPEHGNRTELRKLLRQFDTAMLVTISPEGLPHARPMAMQDLDATDDCDLFFVTSDQSHKVEDTTRDEHVAVVFMRERDGAYVSISARCDRDRSKAEITRLFRPDWKAWFPDGVDDPHLCLLKLHVLHAEWWEPHGRVETLIRAAAGLLRHEPAGKMMPPPKMI